MRVHGLLRLYRISAAFTPAADVVLGYAFCLAWLPGLRLRLPELIAACTASSLIFCSAVALNDVLDRKKDGRQAPGRPIPSGALTPAQGLAAAGAAGLAGLACAAMAGGPVLAAAGVVLVLAVAYNTLSRRIRSLGVVNLGLVRAADVCVGLACAGGFDALSALGESNRWLVPVVYGLYALSLSGVALGERQVRPSLAAAGFFCIAAASSAAFIAVFAIKPGRGGEWHAVLFLALLVLPAAYGLIQGLVRERKGTESLVGHLVSGYLLVAAAPASVLLDPAAGWILAGLFLLSRLLSRVFPPA